ncbi:hypothetical protein RUND412_003663 [Rhizina undulata]
MSSTVATSGGKNYVVEHMEPEMGDWSTLEYIAISTESAASGSNFYLTSVQPALAENLPELLKKHISEQEARGRPSLNVTTAEVSELPDIKRERVCLLDPQSKEELKPEDANGENGFEYFVFGGILGDHPPRDRTAELRKYGYQGRNLGKLQMTTDTAVRVTRMVIEGRQPLDKIPYCDYPELQLNKNESTQMPFRYVKDDSGKPVLPEGMFELIEKDADKSLDDLF